MKHAEKKGATAKFLAMIASFTMILAGIAGVAFAGSAAAADTQDISAKALTSHGCDNTEWHFVITQIDEEANAPASITVTWANSNTATLSRDKFTGGVAHYSTTANLDSTVASATTTIYASWGGEFNLSHGPCGDPGPMSRTVWTCENYKAVSTNQTSTDGGKTWSPSVTDPSEKKLTDADCSQTEKRTVWTCDNGKAKSVDQTSVDGGAWTPAVTDPSEDELTDEDCTKKPVISTDYAYWCANGAEQSANRTVTNGTPGNWNREDVPAEYSEASGLSCTTPEKTCQELNNCPVNNPPSTPVVEAAVVSAPQAATVPEAVAAPAAATVAAPAKVTVPQAATLPAAVPAGDGSQAPGMPMWAIALMAVGLIGAAFSAKGLLTARK